MKRLSPRRVEQSSTVGALMFLVVSAALLWGGQGWWALLPAAFTVWFGIDAWRARQWQKMDEATAEGPR